MKIVVNDADFSNVSLGRASGLVINYDLATDPDTLRPDVVHEGMADYWDTGKSVGLVVTKASVNPNNTPLYSLCIGGIRTGDTVYVKTWGGNGARAWCLADLQKRIVSVSEANADCTSGVTLTASQDGFLYVACAPRKYDVNDVEIRITTV